MTRLGTTRRLRTLLVLLCASLVWMPDAAWAQSSVGSQDIDALSRSADQHFDAGKRALRDGRQDDARKEFDLAVESMLAAAVKAPDKPQVVRHLSDLVDSIYQYDTSQMGAGIEAEEEETPEKRPVDEIIDLSFPVDPLLREKVRSQINATVSQLPLEESDAVLSWVNFFSTPRGQKILGNGLRQSGRYRDMILRILAEEGVPQELIFLAQEESGFQPKIVSYRYCVGLWQFSRDAGIESGLHVNGTIDERMDPEKATRAAARHLKDLYQHFGDWYLAMAAYDCGPGCVDHAITRTGYADFWELRRRNMFVTETANYVPIILAMTIVTKNSKDYGLPEIDYIPAVEYDTIDLPSPTNIGLAAAALDLPVGALKEINPALRKLVAPTGYSLHVPKGTLATLEAAFRAVPENKRDAWRVHKVEASDSFAGVAKRYGVSAAQLTTANGPNLPTEGEFAAIPLPYPGDNPPAKKKPSSTASQAASKKPASTASSASKKQPAKRP